MLWIGDREGANPSMTRARVNREKSARELKSRCGKVNKSNFDVCS
jgi:hypothetical protein